MPYFSKGNVLFPKIMANKIPPRNYIGREIVAYYSDKHKGPGMGMWLVMDSGMC